MHSRFSKTWGRGPKDDPPFLLNTHIRHKRVLLQIMMRFYRFSLTAIFLKVLANKKSGLWRDSLISTRTLILRAEIQSDFLKFDKDS